MEVTTERLTELFKLAMSLLIGEKVMQGNYGYVVMWDGPNNQPIQIFRVGVLPPICVEAYRMISEGNAQRLGLSPQHLTSFRLGGAGAIRVGDYILSFHSTGSGLIDEALVLFVALQSGEINENTALQMAAMSNNSYFSTLLRAHKRSLESPN